MGTLSLNMPCCLAACFAALPPLATVVVAVFVVVAVVSVVAREAPWGSPPPGRSQWEGERGPLGP